MRARSAPWLLAAVLAAAPAAARGQSPADQAALERLQDSLAATDDSASVDVLLARVHRRADSLRGDPMAELRLGLVALRLHEITGNRHARNLAAQAFEGVAESHPEWRMAWFGVARTEMIGTDGSISFGMAKMLGMDPARAIVRDLVRSTGEDSVAVHGIVVIAHQALRARRPVDEEVSIRAMRLLPARALATDAEYALVRARLEREAGEKDSAIAVIERAARLYPDDPAVQRTLGIMRFVVGRSDGARAWYHGLGLADGDALLRYRRDLQVAVPDSVLATFDTVRAAARPTLIRDYWASQDPDGLPTADDRLAEHYRRLEFARHWYVRHTVDRETPIYELDTLGAGTFDDRGLMLLRHGSPDERTSIGRTDGPDVRVSLHIIGMPPNESWVYHDTHDGDRFYHFVAAADDSDFVAVPSILDVLAQSSQFRRFRPNDDPTGEVTKTWGAELVSMVAQDLLRSRQELSPLYTQMINRGMRGADSLQQLEREIGTMALAKPYSYELGFELPLDGAMDIVALGSDAGGSLIQVAFAVPGGDVLPQQLRTGQMAYPLRMRVAVVDGSGRTVVQVDTVRGFVAPRRLRNNEYLLGQLPLRVAPGTYRVRASLESERRGFLSRPTLVQVPAPHGEALGLSDLSIGVRSVRLPWRAPSSDTAWANPLRRFPPGEPMQLYFEVSGLAADAHYNTAIAIDRVAKVPLAANACGGEGGVLSIGFDRTADGGVQRVTREVSLSRLDPGDYQIAVTVTTPAGGRTQRCRQFTVARP